MQEEQERKFTLTLYIWLLTKLHFASEIAETIHLMAYEEQEYTYTFYT